MLREYFLLEKMHLFFVSRTFKLSSITFSSNIYRISAAHAAALLSRVKITGLTGKVNLNLPKARMQSCHHIKKMNNWENRAPDSKPIEIRIP